MNTTVALDRRDPLYSLTSIFRGPVAVWRSRALAVEATLVVAVVMLLGASSLLYPFGRDQGEYAYIASAALEGKIVYSDVFNVKPPATHLLHEAALLLFGHSMMAIRLFDFAWQIATAVVVWLIARQLIARRELRFWAVAVYAAAYYATGYWEEAQTDGFVTLPLGLAILSLLAVKPRHASLAHLLCGVGIGCAVLFKYPIGILLVFLFPLVFTRRELRQSIRDTLLICAGFSVPLALCAGALAWQGALGDFLTTQVNYIPSYTGGGSLLGWRREGDGYVSSMLRDLRQFWWESGTGGRLFPVVFGLSVLFQWRRAASLGPVWAWWLAGAVSLTVQNKFYLYHALPLIAPVGLLVADLAAQAYASSRMRAVRRYRWSLVLATALVAVVGFRALGYGRLTRLSLDVAFGRAPLSAVYESPEFGAFGSGGGFSSSADIQVAEYVASHTEPGQTIFVWGFEPEIYFLSGRDSASTLPYNYPLYGKTLISSLMERFMKDIVTMPPEYFIVEKNDAIPWVTGTTDDSYDVFMKSMDLKGFVESRYVVETTIEDFTLYRYSPGTSLGDHPPNTVEPASR